MPVSVLSVPFFTSHKQLSIHLAEPVVILRGFPQDPVTQVLHGEVELLLTKPINAYSVKVKLVGKQHMLWPEGFGARGTKLYNEKTIYSQTIVLQTWPEDQKEPLSPGLHRWPFEFMLPKDTVETIEDELAKVFYYISTTVHRAGKSVPKLRSRRNILILRTPNWSDQALADTSLPTASITSERHMKMFDSIICIEKSVVSSGTRFPIALTIAPTVKNLFLESINVMLIERRSYRLPEFNARRGEVHDFKLPMATVTNLTDPSLTDIVPASDVSLQHLRKVLCTKNAHIPLEANPFQYRFVFNLPNCVSLNHTTTYHEIEFRHYLRIHIELSVGLPPGGDQKAPREHIHFETPITILDCRLKEDYAALPTYVEALSDPTVNDDDLHESASGFFICPCYLEYKKKRQSNGKREWMLVRQNSNENTPPPPSYESVASKPAAISTA
ncbi:uncharacterized protein BYT42DRAFT_529416 [Radiomyces spectabilis]|uniref:uncharacterized protein n=1 Tax=Radiomyces spectabilis TaxID=64574 RepID=UPI00221F4957|nr:uncharacterized protein BYT42DRAFT_529416 [Radiomyces spectabilis]KAI8384406.1 hypothetical protein BYT42DRAFT_529416 [Radiomyces spectabilis]